MMAKQEATTAYWRTRARSFGPGWINRYRDSWQAPYRQELLTALGHFVGSGARSVLEVGCHCGPNLALWRSHWPQLLLRGFDVSAEAVQAAQAQFADDPNTRVWLEDLMQGLQMPMVDVVVSCYALAYVVPDQLDGVLDRMLSAARRGVIIAEPMVDATKNLVAGPCAVMTEEYRTLDHSGHEASIEEYRHDYLLGISEWLRRQHRRGSLSTTWIDPVFRMNGILTFEHGGP